MQTGIHPDELAARRARLLDHVVGQNLDGYVLFDEKYIQYFTSFGFLATERPVAFVGSAAGELAVFVPEFEVERVREETDFDRVESYPEYPGIEHPMHILGRVLESLGMRRVAADSDGYPGILGYAGPALSDVTGTAVAPLAPFIESLMVRKSAGGGRVDPRERPLVRARAPPAAGVLAARARPRRRRACAPVTRRRSRCSRRSGERFGGQQGSSDGATAGYRGQIGRRSSWAHAVAHNIEFKVGDVLVTETSAPVWGYNAELERAMVIGPPTEEMRRLFAHMLAAQETAFEALRPGVTCADVDNAVLDYFAANDLMPYWRQHVGHAIGLRNHEAPFLDTGDHTRVEEGMVFTIEPGVYSSELGGFRHSDTVVVTSDGIEILTDYPRDLASLTIDPS